MINFLHAKVSLEAICNQNMILNKIKESGWKLKYCCRTFQEKLPDDLLQDLASVLLDGQIFDIVSSLREVQQLQERTMSGTRNALINKHKSKFTMIEDVWAKDFYI